MNKTLIKYNSVSIEDEVGNMDAIGINSDGSYTLTLKVLNSVITFVDTTVKNKVKRRAITNRKISYQVGKELIPRMKELIANNLLYITNTFNTVLSKQRIHSSVEGIDKVKKSIANDINNVLFKITHIFVEDIKGINYLKVAILPVTSNIDSDEKKATLASYIERICSHNTAVKLHREELIINDRVFRMGDHVVEILYIEDIIQIFLSNT